jgi:hypothetical protein
MSNQDITLREQFWSKVGTLNTDVLAPLINPAFAANLPKWPSLQNAYISLTKANGNTVIATDGLSEPFDMTRFPESPNNVNGFEMELYVETDEKIATLQESYVFDILYQMSLQVAASGQVKDMLQKYGLITVELYDVKVPKEYQTLEGTVGVIVGLPSDDVSSKIPLTLSEALIVNVKLLTPQELAYVKQNGAEGRQKLAELFGTTSKTVTNLARQTVV